MIKNFFRIALRVLRRNKFFSIINIMGLSIGISCFFLIAVHVQDEFSYDNFHKNADNIYRLALERIYPDNVVFYSIIPFSIGEAVLNDFPEVLDMTRILASRNPTVLRYQDNRFEEKKILFVAPNFFQVFSIP